MAGAHIVAAIRHSGIADDLQENLRHRKAQSGRC